MAKYGLKWMDSDMHLCEPVDLWEAYIDPQYKEWIPHWSGVVGQDHPLRNRGVFTVGQQEVKPESGAEPPDNIIRQRRFPIYEPYMCSDGTHVDPDGQLRAMATEGIDVAILFPTFGNRGWQDEKVPSDAAMALARAYNDWLHDFCQTDQARLKLNALIPITDPAAAVQEVRRAVTKLGAVCVSPGTSRGDIRLDDMKYEPIWDECERLGVAAAFHGARQVHLKERYKDSVLLAHASGRGIEHPVAFMELLAGGVLERHPNLRCAFLEAGCSWVPYWLFRLEEEWERFRGAMPDLAKNVTMAPVEYWKRQCYSAVEVDEWSLQGVVATVGDDNLVISSDFPHFDSPFPEAFDRFMKIPGVSRESKAKILWDNCAKLYNLN
jgi:predicted TIM-barrel fold metal-dependent hydrolase